MAIPAISPDRRDPEMAKMLFLIYNDQIVQNRTFLYENVLVFGMVVEQCMNKLCI